MAVRGEVGEVLNGLIYKKYFAFTMLSADGPDPLV